MNMDTYVKYGKQSCSLSVKSNTKEMGIFPQLFEKLCNLGAIYSIISPKSFCFNLLKFVRSVNLFNSFSK
jgi:hypothetical protein